MRIFLSIILSAFISVAGMAQRQYTITSYTQEQGLPSSTITGGLWKDKTGYLWLGSEDWIARFDGYKFKAFQYNPDDSTGLPANTVFALDFDVNGQMYFHNADVMRFYDPKTYSFVRSPIFGDSVLIDKFFSLKDDKENRYGVNKNALYQAGKDGVIVFQFTGISFPYTHFSTDSVRYAIIYTGENAQAWVFDCHSNKLERIRLLTATGKEDSTVINTCVFSKAENTFYAVCTNKLYRYNHDSKCFEEQFDLPKFPERDVTPGYPTLIDEKLLFVGTAHGELYKLDLSTGIEKLFRVNKRIPESEVLLREIVKIKVDEDGWLWLSTAEMGLFHFDPVNENWQQYIHEPNNPNSLPSNRTEFVQPDEHGVVWVACKGKGLVKMEPVTTVLKKKSAGLSKSASTKQAPNADIRTFLETENGYLVGTLTGLFAYNSAIDAFTDGSYLHPDLHDEKDQHPIGGLARDSSKNIWVGTWWSLLSVFNPELNKKIALQVPVPASLKTIRIWYRDIYCDHEKNIWIATYGQGLYRVKAGSLNFENPSLTKIEIWTTNEKDSSSISSNAVFAITEDADKNIWVGTENGLNRFNSSSGLWTRYYYERGDSTSLHSNNVRSFELDKEGNLWIGTNGGGLNRYNKAKNNFTHFTTDNGLPNNSIYSLQCDNSGMLWMGTNRGLGRFNPTDFTCRNFTDKDSIQDYEFNTGASLKLKDGTLLFGGINGFNIINPDQIENKKSKPPVVVITSLKVNEKERPPGNNHLELRFFENSIGFEFAALSFFRNEENQYAYMLEGADQAWINGENRRYVSYTKLQPGDYTFRVKARNSDGVWNEEGASMVITIFPPWWNTTWARILFVLVVVGLIAGYFRYRTHALRVRQKELEMEVEKATVLIKNEKKKSDDLLLNILPSEVAEELKEKGNADAKHFNEVTVLFTDFKNFTGLSEKLTAQELVNEINYCYSAFDNLIAKYRIEKIKTIGDAYMCAGGLPVPNETNAEDAVRAAIEIRDFMLREKQKRDAEGKPFFEIRIGCHTGPVVAGIVGIKKFAYDIWGDTVNIASRMESSGEAGKINISETTYELVKDKFKCEHRGKIQAKNKGEIDMYFVSKTEFKA